jgi:hypothetical protein
MKEYLNWAVVMIQMAHKDPDKARESRKRWADHILNGIKSYRGSNGEKAEEAKYLTDILADEDTWELVGFAPNLQYIRYDHDNDNMLKFLFVHPWGTPPLVFKHKRLPMFITVGPGIRWNDSILREITDNGYNDHVEGATG